MIISAAVVGRRELRRGYVRYVVLALALPYVALCLALAGDWTGRRAVEPLFGLIFGFLFAYRIALWFDPELREISRETRMGKRTRPQ
jgi:hypothetical protein